MDDPYPQQHLAYQMEDSRRLLESAGTELEPSVQTPLRASAAEFIPFALESSPWTDYQQVSEPRSVGEPTEEPPAADSPAREDPGLAVDPPAVAGAEASVQAPPVSAEAQPPIAARNWKALLGDNRSLLRRHEGGQAAVEMQQPPAQLQRPAEAPAPAPTAVPVSAPASGIVSTSVPGHAAVTATGRQEPATHPARQDAQSWATRLGDSRDLSRRARPSTRRDEPEPEASPAPQFGSGGVAADMSSESPPRWQLLERLGRVPSQSLPASLQRIQAEAIAASIASPAGFQDSASANSRSDEHHAANGQSGFVEQPPRQTPAGSTRRGEELIIEQSSAPSTSEDPWFAGSDPWSVGRRERVPHQQPAATEARVGRHGPRPAQQSTASQARREAHATILSPVVSREMDVEASIAGEGQYRVFSSSSEANIAPNEPRRQPRGCTVVAIRDWRTPQSGMPDRTSYLAVNQGDRFVLVHPSNEGFFGAYNIQTGEEGWIPEEVVTTEDAAEEQATSQTLGNAGAPSASADEEPAAPAAPTEVAQRPRWRSFQCPQTLRAWFWNEATDAHFFADNPGDWKRYQDQQERDWWYNEATGDWFYPSN